MASFYEEALIEVEIEVVISMGGGGGGGGGRAVWRQFSSTERFSTKTGFIFIRTFFIRKSRRFFRVKSTNIFWVHAHKVVVQCATSGFQRGGKQGVGCGCPARWTHRSPAGCCGQ